MIKSFSGRVVFYFAIPEPYLLMLAKTDYSSISILSIYLHILPYALADILGSCALSSNVSRERKRIKA